MSRLCRRAMLQRDSEIRQLLARVEGAACAHDARAHADARAQGGVRDVSGHTRSDAMRGGEDGAGEPEVGMDPEGSEAPSGSYMAAKRRSARYRAARDALLSAESPFCGWMTNADSYARFRC